MFVIRNSYDNTYWSNEDGWITEIENATIFSENEHRNFSLPIHGIWVNAWNIKILQFARLIAACETIGLFEKDYNVLRREMDLAPGQLSIIIDDAQTMWDKIKSNTLP